MEKPFEARRRKPDTRKTDLEPPIDVLRRTGCPPRGGIIRVCGEVSGCHRLGEAPDEQIGQRWDQVEPALWGEGVTHSPIVPRCLLTARYGRFMRDLRRPVSVLVFDQVSDPISGSEVGSDAPTGVGERNST